MILLTDPLSLQMFDLFYSFLGLFFASSIILTYALKIWL